MMLFLSNYGGLARNYSESVSLIFNPDTFR